MYEKAPLPENEPARLEALKKHRILDTLPEQAYDDITLIASHICSTPISMVSLVDKKRQWFKSKVGIKTKETPRDVAFCAHAILKPNDLFIVGDAILDPRFSDNPLVSKDPKIRFYAGAPLVTEDGLALGALCVIDTEPRRLSEEQINILKALARQVEYLLKLRLKTVQLENTIEELEKAKQKAQEAAQIKAEFTSLVSHELRTPLTVIKEGIDIVLDKTAGDINREQEDYLGTAKRNVDRLSRLINDVLDYQKLESGRMDFSIQMNNLNALVSETARGFEGVAAKKGLEIETICGQDLPQIPCDHDKIIQVVTNFLSNAIKFSEKGPIIVSVEKGNNHIRVSIKDKGPGIKPEDQNKLFKSFSQLSTGQNRKTGGTGLGLAISKKIIEAHNGKIGVESNAGSGSTFYFILPIIERRI